MAQSINHLYLAGTHITDAGLKHLAKLPDLHGVNLEGVSLSKVSLKALAECKTIRWLVLDWTSITDDDLECLTPLHALTMLRARRTRLTPAGIDTWKSKHQIAVEVKL